MTLMAQGAAMGDEHWLRYHRTDAGEHYLLSQKQIMELGTASEIVENRKQSIVGIASSTKTAHYDVVVGGGAG